MIEPRHFVRVPGRLGVNTVSVLLWLMSVTGLTLTVSGVVLAIPSTPFLPANVTVVFWIFVAVELFLIILQTISGFLVIRLNVAGWFLAIIVSGLAIGYSILNLIFLLVVSPVLSVIADADLLTMVRTQVNAVLIWLLFVLLASVSVIVILNTRNQRLLFGRYAR